MTARHLENQGRPHSQEERAGRPQPEGAYMLIKPTTPFPVATQTRDGDLYADYHPRLRAVQHLRESLADGRAGLDPYDETVFLLDALPHETVWTRAVTELTGLFLSSVCRDSGTRIRMILEADIRQELGLDKPGAPLLADEPLASRSVDSLLGATDEAIRLATRPSPVLRAIDDARQAQQRMLERRGD